MTAPLIGISGVVRSVDNADRTGVNAAYVRAITRAGGVPLILSPLMGPEQGARALATLHGLILSGGEDVDPDYYGDPRSPGLGAVDRMRDAFELALFAAARARRLPVLAICRGLQLVNVALGGSLWQDLPSERPGAEHASTGPRNARDHRVRLQPGSRTAKALRRFEISTNSFHHQAIKQLADGLTATGWAEDGVIEAVEGGAGDHWLVCVQWHPEEFHAEKGAPDQGLFAALVEAAINESPNPAPPYPARRTPERRRGRSRR